MTDLEMAEAVERALGGNKIYCPFCDSPDTNCVLVQGEHGINEKMPANWMTAICERCQKVFYRHNPGSGYRVGKYWTTSWRDVYEADRKSIWNRR